MDQTLTKRNRIHHVPLLSPRSQRHPSLLLANLPTLTTSVCCLLFSEDGVNISCSVGDSAIPDVRRVVPVEEDRRELFLKLL